MSGDAIMVREFHSERLVVPPEEDGPVASADTFELALQRLRPIEREVLMALARGLTSKEISNLLDLPATTVSRRLAIVRVKLGLRSTYDVVRVAARLLPSVESWPLKSEITSSERAVLELVQAGYSNKEIAFLRGRAQNTIANQIASLLRKTGSTSRRALVARTDLT